MTCDSGRPPKGENSRSEVECEAGQSGAERASPKASGHTPDAKVELARNAIRSAGVPMLTFADADKLARAAIAALEQSDAVMGEDWQLIETAPLNAPVLLSNGDETETGCIGRAVAGNLLFLNTHGSGLLGFDPTHWQPLPASPGSTPIAPVQDDDYRSRAKAQIDSGASKENIVLDSTLVQDDDAEERLIESVTGRTVQFENDLLTVAEVRRVIRTVSQGKLEVEG